MFCKFISYFMIYIWQIYCQYFETFFAYFIPNQILLDVKADVILRIVSSHEKNSWHVTVYPILLFVFFSIKITILPSF